MALAERAQLIASLDLQDNLSPGLAKAETSLIRMGGAVDTAAKKAGGLSSSFASLAAGFGAGFVAFKGVEVIGNAIDAASNLNETLSKSNVVFGQSATVVSDWGDTAAKSFGLSKQAAVEAAASFGNLFSGFGLTSGQAAGMSENIVQLASDLASFNNIGTDEALQKIRSGLVGEAEPLRSVGVLLNEATVQAKAVELGFQKVNGVFTEAQKVQARYAIILEQTKTAQGDFARTSDGLANSQRIANAELEDAMAKLGAALLPLATEGAKAIATVAKAAADASKDLGQFVDIVGDIVDAAAKVKAQASDGWRLPIVADAIDAVATGARQLRENNVALLTPMIQTSQAAAQQATDFSDVTRAQLLASEAADEYQAKQNALTAATEGSLGTFNGWTVQIGQAGAALTLLGASAAELPPKLDDVAAAAARVQANLASIERNISINIRMRTTTEGGPGLPPGSADVEPGTQFGTGAGDQAALDARERSRQQQNADNARRAADAERVRDEAKRKRDAANRAAAAEAKRDAAELAQATREKVANSYDVAKRASDRLFDSLHDRHVKAIKDAETLAEKQHDAAVQNINDTLAAQKIANAAPVTAAEKAQSDTEASRQRRNLVESVQAAQQALATNRDQTRALDLQRSLRDATESLQSFDANRAIDRLKGAQAIQDQAAENAAKIARDKADADLEAAKTKAAADEKFVNTRDAKRKQDFDTALAALRKRDEQDPAKFLTDLKQLQTKFGIFTDERGFTHIGDVVADAITKTKPPPVNVTLTVPRGAIQLNGRDVNNAVTVGISPTQSQSARSGNARPRT